jgi:uncharacterized protein
MRIIYSSDLHGHTDFYRQLFALAVAEQANAILLGGDLLPHALQRATAIAAQRRFVSDELAPLLRAFRQQRPDCMVYTIPGNDDWAAAYATLAALEGENLLIDVHLRVVPLDRVLSLAGCGLIGLTPYAIKDYERRDLFDEPPARFAQALRSDSGEITPIDQYALLGLPSLAEELAQLATKSDPRRTLYMFHAPPWQSQLDRRTGGAATGSRAVRDFIRQQEPPLTLHGHVHEAPTVSGAWLEAIGNTISINPGQAQPGFHAVVLDTDDPGGTARHTVYH